MKLLDLFCKAGGCSMGYVLAGFDVTGIDIEPQPHYPFSFTRADALEVLTSWDLSDYDVIHASPPCQHYSAITHLAGTRDKHPDLLARVRALLMATGKPWIIENVPGSPVQSGLVLCGSMFDLPLRRHRHFETSHFLFAPRSCNHTGPIYSIHGGHVWNTAKKTKIVNPSWKGGFYNRPSMTSKTEGMQAMGITWDMTQEELSNAIPPTYTRYIGLQLRDILNCNRGN